jgi:hypothetical protein
MGRKLRQQAPPTEIHEKKESVVTPGGARPKKQVHPVKPGETIRRNEDGTYTIVRTQPTDKK